MSRNVAAPRPRGTDLEALERMRRRLPRVRRDGAVRSPPCLGRRRSPRSEAVCRCLTSVGQFQASGEFSTVASPTGAFAHRRFRPAPCRLLQPVGPGRQRLVRGRADPTGPVHPFTRVRRSPGAAKGILRRGAAPGAGPTFAISMPAAEWPFDSAPGQEPAASNSAAVRARWSRIACSASAESPAATASTIRRCSSTTGSRLNPRERRRSVA